MIFLPGPIAGDGPWPAGDIKFGRIACVGKGSDLSNTLLTGTRKSELRQLDQVPPVRRGGEWP